MRIFKIKAFDHWAAKIGLHNEFLRRAVIEIEQGKYEVSLGGCLYKKRIALGNKGKSGGVRTIIAFKRDDRAVFIYGFSKGRKSNVTEKELVALKKITRIYFTYSKEQIEKVLKVKEFVGVK